MCCCEGASSVCRRPLHRRWGGNTTTGRVRRTGRATDRSAVFAVFRSARPVTWHLGRAPKPVSSALLRTWLIAMPTALSSTNVSVLREIWCGMQQPFYSTSLNEWMNSFAWQKNKTISQAGTPRHDNCVRLPMSWINNYATPRDNWLRS